MHIVCFVAHLLQTRACTFICNNGQGKLRVTEIQDFLNKHEFIVVYSKMANKGRLTMAIQLQMKISKRTHIQTDNFPSNGG